jgi:hypothetical protein
MAPRLFSSYIWPRSVSFFHESQDNLWKVTLIHMILNEEQIRALATTDPRPDAEVILHDCISLPNGNGCRGALVECPQRDRGPAQLI